MITITYNYNHGVYWYFYPVRLLPPNFNIPSPSVYVYHLTTGTPRQTRDFDACRKRCRKGLIQHKAATAFDGTKLARNLL